jgi:hypothetical protein
MKSKLLTSLLFSALLGTSRAYALPVLSETAGGISTDIMTLFKDHEDPNLYYFLPNSGAFSRNADGTPVFSLTTWGLNGSPNDGGGFMSFVLRGGLSPEVKRAIDTWLSHNPGKRLAVVPIYNSFITAMGVNGSDQKEVTKNWQTMFKAIDLPPNGGVAESELSVNVMLTTIGAKVFKAQLKSSVPTTFGLNLCYTVQGATPAMDAMVTLHYKHIYEKFEAEFSGGGWWWSENVKSVVEKLRNEGLITINILGGDAKLEDYMNRLTDEFIKQFMVQRLPDTGAGTSSSGGLYQFSISSTYKEERNDATIHLIRRDFIQNKYCNALPMKDIAPYADKLLVDAD